MSLKGSLQTVALPEVLNFLSDNGKSGEFQVSGSHGDGRLWFAEGRISGFQAARAEKPFEAIFELLRIEDGEFTFDADAERPADAVVTGDEEGEVRSALEAAEARMAEWREIVEVVPSLGHRLQLRGDRPGEEVILDPDQWMMVVAIGAGHTVGEVIEERGLQEFDGCRAVRALVDAALVEVLEPEVAPMMAQPVVEETPVVAGLAGFGSYTAVLDASPYAQFPAVTEPAAVDYFGVSEQAAELEPVAAVPEDAVEESAEHSYEGTDEGMDDVTVAHQDIEETEGDRYAALRAAMVEVGDDLGAGDGEPVEDQPVHTYELHADYPTDGRAALQALLSEVTAESGPEPALSDEEAVDGLADRGPWTEHELTAMDSDHGWHEDAEASHDEASNIVPFAPVHAEAAADAEAAEPDPDDSEEAAPAEEPINRGLLLKFLSSVRN